jgi:2-methylcitrate dehydratase PrpD
MSWKKFAEFIVDVDFKKRISYQSHEYIKKLIIDTIFCSIAGSKGPYAETIIKTFTKISNSEQSSIICSHQKTSIHYAALVNSFLARNYTFDDVYEPGIIHSGAAVIMSSFALGEWLQASIDESLAAIISGYEVALRVADAINPSHYDKGFHPTGTCNAIGVAALASKLFCLDEEKIITALRLAADMACGFRQYQVDGNIANSAFHAAKAAENGIVAAMLAKEGFSDPGDTISGKFGLFNSMADGCKEKKLFEGLGTTFRFLETSLKPYPSCRYMHGAVDAAAKCKNKSNLITKDIKKINVYTYRMAFEEGNRPHPKTVLDGQFSIHYNIATHFLKNTIGIEDFTQEGIQKKETLELCRKINVYEDRELTKKYPEQWPYRVEIITESGQVFNHEVLFLPGSPANPLSTEEFEKKCLLLAKPVIGDEKGKELFNRLQNIEAFLTVDNLFNYLKVLTAVGGN